MSSRSLQRLAEQTKSPTSLLSTSTVVSLVSYGALFSPGSLSSTPDLSPDTF